jgi:hypothetical protein
MEKLLDINTVFFSFLKCTLVYNLINGKQFNVTVAYFNFLLKKCFA